jgi:hypothetical protein
MTKQSKIEIKSPIKKPFVALLVFVGIGLLAVFTQGSPNIKNAPAKVAERKESVTSLNKHVENYVNFFTKIFGSGEKTRVVIPYRFDPGSEQILWVGFNPKSTDKLKSYLVYHPELAKMKWNRIDEGEIHLYQIKKKYQSVTQFMQNLPDMNRVATDPLLKEKYPSLKSAINIDDNDNFRLEKVDFILTTFLPSEEQDGLWYYENIIDATSAKLDDANQIYWFIKAPDVTLNKPYYLGTIHVGFE